MPRNGRAVAPWRHGCAGHIEFRVSRSLFHAADRSWMQAWSGQLVALAGDQPVQVRVADDPTWRVYEYLVPLAREAAPDLRVITALEDQGCDLSRPRHVRYFFYFDSEESARTVAEVLKAVDMAIEQAEETNDGRCAVIASRVEQVTPWRAAEMREGL